MKDYEISVLIGGKAVDVYTSNENEHWIEGRSGSAYEFLLKNNTWNDSEFVITCDGLSILNGKAASKDSPGYIVKAKSSSTITGWLVDNNTAAKFVFGAKDTSYTNQMGNGTDNTGVIGIRVYKQKVKLATDWTKILEDNWTYRPKPYYPKYPTYPHQPYWYSDRSWFNDYYVGDTWPYNNTVMCGAVVPTASSSSALRSATMNIVATGPAISTFEQPDEVSSLGTEFGEATKMKTTQVSFERASEVPDFEQTLYYGSAKDLNLKGIVLVYQQKAVKPKPNPFPGDFCTPTTNWKK